MLRDLYWPIKKKSSHEFTNFVHKRLLFWYEFFIRRFQNPEETYLSLMEQASRQLLLILLFCEHDAPPKEGDKSEQCNMYYEEETKFKNEEALLTTNLVELWKSLGGTKMDRAEQFAAIDLIYYETMAILQFTLESFKVRYFHLIYHLLQLVLVFGASINFSSSMLESYMGNSAHKTNFRFFWIKTSEKKEFTRRQLNSVPTGRLHTPKELNNWISQRKELHSTKMTELSPSLRRWTSQ